MKGIRMASGAAVDISSLIESHPELHGGRPCLAGTGMTVLSVARRYLQGERAEEMAADLPDIPLSHIHAAIAHYLANREGVDAELTEDQAEADRLFAAWERQIGAAMAAQARGRASTSLGESCVELAGGIRRGVRLRQEGLVMSDKEAALRLIERVPDDASLEEIMYAIYFRQRIDRGLRELDEGRTLSHEEIQRSLADWLRSAGQ